MDSHASTRTWAPVSIAASADAGLPLENLGRRDKLGCLQSAPCMVLRSKSSVALWPQTYTKMLPSQYWDACKIEAKT